MNITLLMTRLAGSPLGDYSFDELAKQLVGGRELSASERSMLGKMLSRCEGRFLNSRRAFMILGGPGRGTYRLYNSEPGEVPLMPHPEGADLFFEVDVSEAPDSSLEALERVTRDYVAGYRYCPDEDGPAHVPCATERDMLLDAINGLVADLAFRKAFLAWFNASLNPCQA